MIINIKERHKKLLDLLNQNEMMEVSDLARILDCSMMTIRRDLESLSTEGLVKKIHGGAVSVKSNDFLQPSFYERIKENSEEKNRIGKAAVNLLQNDDIVFFDGSTTSLAVVDNIPGSLSLTAITNGLVTATRLASMPNINVIIIGGDVNSPTLSSANYVAKSQIEIYKADYFFLSTNSVLYPEGIYEKSMSLIEIKKSFAAQAKKTVLLADHRKFNRNSLSLSLEFKDISIMITDKKTPAAILDQIRASNVEVIVV